MTARDARHWTGHEGLAGPVESVVVTIAAFALLPLGGAPLQARFGVGGLVITELLCVLAPALVATWWSRAPVPTALGLAAPPWPALAGTALCALGGFYLMAGGVEVLQERALPLPAEVREQLRRVLLPVSGRRPLAVDLVALALVPAACEEALFRGVLLRSLATLSPGGAVLFTSLAFGAFHYSLYKFVPTALLGVLLAVLARRTGSLYAPILAHAINNALVVVLVRSGLDGIFDAPGTGGAPSPLWLIVAALALVAGLRIAAVRRIR